MNDSDIIIAMHTNNDCYKAARPIVGPKGIVVHSTAAPNPWLKRYVDCPEQCGVNKAGNHWNHSSKEMGRSVCAHAFIGYDKDKRIRVAQILPYEYQNWLTGGSANKTHIGFEICEPADLGDKAYFSEMWNVVVDYCAYLCKRFNLDPLGENVIIDHATAHKLGWGNNHGDVKHWWPKYHGVYLDDLRMAVAQRMGLKQPDIPTEPPKPEKPEEEPKMDKVYRVQVGAFAVHDNAKKMLEKLKALGFDGVIVESGKDAGKNGTAIVNGNWNVRSGPGMEHGIVGLAREGEVYELSGEEQGHWVGILYGGAKAWISKSGVANK